jgi:hypothetical protein
MQLFGIEPQPPLEPLWMLLPLIAAGLFVWAIVRSKKQTGLATVAQLVVAIFLVVLFAYILIPPVARVRLRPQVDDTGGDPDLIAIRKHGFLERAEEKAGRPVVRVELSTHVTDDDLVHLRDHLKNVSTLEELSLGYAKNITDAGLAAVADIGQIQRLSLAVTPISDQGLKHLAGLKNLRGLWLTSTRVSDSGLENLKELASLEELYLGESRVTGKGLIHLKPLKRLNTLWLTRTATSDQDMEHLVEFAVLEDLNLAGTQVSDAALAYLKKITSLKKINLYATRFTGAGIDELKSSFVDIHINR